MTPTEPLAVGDVLSVAHFDEIEWTNPAATEQLPAHLVAVARQIKRKGLVAGACGFFASHVTFPAGHVADPHSHSHSELFVLLSGSLELRAGDTIAVLRRQRCGGDPGRPDLRVHGRSRGGGLPPRPHRAGDPHDRVM